VSFHEAVSLLSLVCKGNPFRLVSVWGPPTGYNLFTLQVVEFIASRQQAAAETAI
jgi:hypothetical protein